MKALARRIAVPALLFVAVLAGGTIAVNAFTADASELQPPAQAPSAVPMQVEDDGGIGIVSDASTEDAPSVIDGGVNDAITLVPDGPVPILDAEVTLDTALFFDAPELPGTPPGTAPPTP
jgi:hypothetical protein